MERIIRIILTIVSTLTFVVLLATNLVQFIPPQSVFSILYYLSIPFPYILFASLIILAFCFYYRAKIAIIILAIALAISTPNITKTISFTADRPIIDTTNKTYKVLNYNVHYFNYTNQITQQLKYIASTNADIICLQEFCYKQSGVLSLSNIKKIFKNYPYMHIKTYKDGSKQKGFATFSKHKIVDRIKIQTPINSRQGAIASTILIGNQKIQIINTQLESNKLTGYEKSFYASENKDKTIKRIGDKLLSASYRRGIQADYIHEAMRKDIPSIICGDFNDVPISYVYRTLKKDAIDPFLKLRRGFGNTWYEGLYRFRIDYIFTNKFIEPITYNIENQKFSDHRPIKMSFQIK